MQIKIQHDSNAPVILIDGPDTSVDKTAGPTGMSGSSGVASQVRQAIRAAAAQPLQRGCTQHPLRFSGVRVCATAADARSWLYGHLNTVPRDNKLILTEGGVTIEIADAVLQDIGYAFRGASVFIDYTTIGGAISVT